MTQSFNTTSSMGRLTLNVLLSFAQFEREVIGERVRDKIAASKRKGIWVGGPVPLGYRSVGKKLEVVPEEAALVRKIFADYLRLGSVGALAAALERGGDQAETAPCSPMERPSRLRTSRVGPLAHILKNRFYIGEVVYRGEIHHGEHEPILDRDLFEAVQSALAERAVRAKAQAITIAIVPRRSDLRRSRRADEPEPRQQEGRALSLLCLAGAAAKPQGRGRHRSPACRRPTSRRSSSRRSRLPDAKISLAIEPSGPAAASIGESDSPARRERLGSGTGDGMAGQIAILLRSANSRIRSTDDEGEPGASLELAIPFAPSGPVRKGVIHAPAERGPTDPKTRDALLQAIARSRGWMDAMLSGAAAIVRRYRGRRKSRRTPHPFSGAARILVAAR